MLLLTIISEQKIILVVTSEFKLETTTTYQIGFTVKVSCKIL